MSGLFAGIIFFGLLWLYFACERAERQKWIDRLPPGDKDAWHG